MSSSGGRASPVGSFTPAAPGGPVPCPASKRKCGEGGVLREVRRSGGSGRETENQIYGRTAEPRPEKSKVPTHWDQKQSQD
ncbi:hypothetical protein INR49_008033, partial [Caranx melampygus]